MFCLQFLTVSILKKALLKKFISGSIIRSMNMIVNTTPILHLNSEDVSEYVMLISEEPDSIGKVLSDVGVTEGFNWEHFKQEKVKLRWGFNIFNTKILNKTVTVVIQPIGGPNVALVVEELALMGAKVIIRVGTSGGIGEDIRKGDFVVTTGAYRKDGTSVSYIDAGYPAVADYRLVDLLVKASKTLNKRVHSGITVTIDAFNVFNKAKKRDKLISMSFGGFEQSATRELISDCKKARVLNVDMETATLLTLGNLFGIRCASLSIVADLVPWEPGESLDFEKHYSSLIETAIKAFELLLSDNIVT